MADETKRADDQRAPATGNTEEMSGGRRNAVRAILALTTLLAIVGIFAVWANRQLLNTDYWTDTSSALLESPPIRAEISDFLVDELYTNVDVSGEVEQVLPEALKPLATPVAGALRQVLDQAANKALEDARVQAVFEDANRITHEQFVALVEGKDSGVIQTPQGGAVILDLRPILGSVAARAGLPASVQEKLPPDAGRLTVLQSDAVDGLQKGAKLLKALAVVLTLLVIGGYGLALYLARGRRRQTVMNIGISLIVACVVVLVLRGVVGDAVVNSLAQTDAVVPAADAAWSISTDLLATMAGAAAFIGIPFILAALLAGPSGPATDARRWMAPTLRDRPEILYGVTGLLVVLLFAWGPIPATRQPFGMLLFTALAFAGAWALQRQTAEEFPDAVANPGALREAVRKRTRRSSAPATAAVASRRAPAASDRVAKLERLSALRDGGALSEEEFAAEKARLLGE